MDNFGKIEKKTEWMKKNNNKNIQSINSVDVFIWEIFFYILLIEWKKTLMIMMMIAIL